MNIADLVTTSRPEYRHVGIHYPNRLNLVHDAKRLYLELGIACILQDNDLLLDVPRVMAPWMAGLLERATGRMAFSNWTED